MAEKQEANAAKTAESAVVPAMLPVCISDKALLVAEELKLPSPKPSSRIEALRRSTTGGTTWLLAAIALPTIGVLLLLTLILVAEPLDNDRRLGMNDATFWKGRWRKSHVEKRNIFILDINSPNFPTTSKMATLESCLQNNKNNEIYHLTINLYADQPRNVTPFTKLKKKYNNFHFLFQNAPSYFRRSLFEDATSDPRDIMLFKAQLLMLWRYAGLVLAPDWTCLQPLDQFFAKDDKTIVVGVNGHHLGVLSVHNTCNAKLFDIMRQAKITSGFSALDVIEQVSLKYKSGFKVLDGPEICTNNTINSKCIVMQGPPSPINAIFKRIRSGEDVKIRRIQIVPGNIEITQEPSETLVDYKKEEPMIENTTRPTDSNTTQENAKKPSKYDRYSYEPFRYIGEIPRLVRRFWIY